MFASPVAPSVCVPVCTISCACAYHGCVSFTCTTMMCVVVSPARPLPTFPPTHTHRDGAACSRTAAASRTALFCRRTRSCRPLPSSAATPVRRGCRNAVCCACVLLLRSHGLCCCFDSARGGRAARGHQGGAQGPDQVGAACCLCVCVCGAAGASLSQGSPSLWLLFSCLFSQGPLQQVPGRTSVAQLRKKRRKSEYRVESGLW